MATPTSPRTGYSLFNLTLRLGGIPLRADVITYTPDQEAQFLQKQDMHGTGFHVYMAGRNGTVALEVKPTQKLTVDFLHSFAEAADISFSVGGNPGAASILQPFLLLDPASGSFIVSAFARVQGHPANMSWDAERDDNYEFTILALDNSVGIRGFFGA